MGYLLGRNITCLRRPGRLHNEEILNGAFWQEHRRLESILSSISLTLHYHPRLQTTLLDTNIVFMNILLHTTVICHHQAFMFKGNWNDLPQKMVSGSRARCVMGAMEITRILKMVKYTDLIVVRHPLISRGLELTDNS